jgi:hypothetical protein
MWSASLRLAGGSTGSTVLPLFYSVNFPVVHSLNLRDRQASGMSIAHAHHENVAACSHHDVAVAVRQVMVYAVEQCFFLQSYKDISEVQYKRKSGLRGLYRLFTLRATTGLRLGLHEKKIRATPDTRSPNYCL